MIETDKTKNIIYAICGVTLLISVIYLFFDLHIINLGGNGEDENSSIANETVTPTPEQETPVEQISFVQNAYSIHTGETTIIEVIITPAVAETSTITWKSSDVLIAEVDQNGYVIGKGEGTAIITAESDNGIIAEASVSVAPSNGKIIELNQVTLSKKSTSIKVGQSETLQATISPSNATYKTLIWSSSNPSIVTVNENGKIVAMQEGSATITVKSNNGKSDSVTVSVEKSSSPNVEVTSVSLSKNNITLEIGQSSTITASVNPKNATVKAVTWSSSNSTVATVTQTGKITAKSKGTATITAKSNNGKTASLTVTVNDPIIDVTSVVVSRNSVQLEVGISTTVTASVRPDNATNKSITWKSNNTSIATVDVNGLITGVGAGTTTITAKSNNGKSASIYVSVTKKISLVEVQSVALSKTSLALVVGGSDSIVATITPSNATNKTITWSSNNSNIAKVDANGKVTAVSSGTATITATSNNGKKASAVVTVTAPVIPIAANGKINNSYFNITTGENVKKGIAKNNSDGITKALKYASTNGIKNVYLEKGTYVVANIVDDSDNNNNAAIQMASNVNLNLNNSVIQLLTNYDPKYAVIYFNNVQNASIRNGKIVGDRETHRCNSSGKLIDSYSADDEKKCGSSHGGTHEWGFGIKILASRNITIDDLSISYMTGDGIYMRIRGKHTGTYKTDNITITNNRISKCRRQGISVVSGSNVKIENNKIHNIHGAAPQLGIDLEPNQDFDIIEKVSIISNTIYDLGNSKSIGAVGQTDTINNSITIKNNSLVSCICIPNKKPTLSGNKRINNQGNSASGNWNTNCPYQ